ncbi:MAG TPA: gas vesicle protein GvpN, partial [Allocoleopsis sp.]
MNTKRTIVKVRPGQFIITPSIEKLANRALLYLKSGFSIHLRGPAGTGKTTLALHLADILARPIMLLFGDEQFTSADLIGSQSGYTQKRLVDNFIHSVLKVEDEVKQNWVDSRLTVACREGFTLIYDEFNRSRPEVNNVLLSALEEKLIALPPNYNRPEYLHVHQDFRAIFTSNPEEYAGVHDTQDALMDRLITINMPAPDELTQSEILVQKLGLDREDAFKIVRLVKGFQDQTKSNKISGIRPVMMLAKICLENDISISSDDATFRDVCGDILLSRSNLPLSEAKPILWDLINNITLIDDDNSDYMLEYLPEELEVKERVDYDEEQLEEQLEEQFYEDEEQLEEELEIKSKLDYDQEQLEDEQTPLELITINQRSELTEIQDTTGLELITINQDTLAQENAKNEEEKENISPYELEVFNYLQKS